MMLLERSSSKKRPGKSFARGIQKVTVLASVDTRGNVHRQARPTEKNKFNIS
jgi:hypothetical protein